MLLFICWMLEEDMMPLVIQAGRRGTCETYTSSPWPLFPGEMSSVCLHFSQKNHLFRLILCCILCVCVCVRKYLFVCPESRLFGPIFNSFSSSWITLWENCWATDAPHFLSFLASSLPLLWFIAVHKSLVCVIEMVFWSLRAFFTVFPTPLASIPLHRNSLALLTFILSNTSLTNWTGISSFSMCQSSGECLTAWDVF